jgi:hypothetical protein
MDGTYQELQMVTVEVNRGRVTVYEPVRVTVPGCSTLAYRHPSRIRKCCNRTAVTCTVELPATKLVASGQYVSKEVMTSVMTEALELAEARAPAAKATIEAAVKRILTDVVDEIDYVDQKINRRSRFVGR